MKALMWVIAGALALVVLLLAIWTLGGLNKAEQWPIRWLEVAGELDRTTAEQVRASVASEASSGFFAIDIERARLAVESLPWVNKASISRRWPDALEIHVLEHRVVARWNQTGLLSAAGAVFDVAGTSGMQGLTHLRGPESRREDVFETWQELRRQLLNAGLEINQLELDPRGAWSMHLDSGQAVLLGREQVHSRMQRFLSVHRQLIDMDSIERIDLRYPNGLAIIRRVLASERELNQPSELLESTAKSNQQLQLMRESGVEVNHG